MSNAADRLLGVMDARSKGANTGSELSYGTVSSVNPMVIVRDDGAELTAGFLVLSKMCKPYSINTAQHAHRIPSGTSSEELQILQLWPGLSIGEKVILLSFNNSQKFFVERM